MIFSSQYKQNGVAYKSVANHDRGFQQAKLDDLSPLSMARYESRKRQKRQKRWKPLSFRAEQSRFRHFRCFQDSHLLIRPGMNIGNNENAETLFFPSNKNQKIKTENLKS